MAHMHYKGTGKVHSFRGMLGDGDQRKIRISGPVGAIAWRIVKLEAMPNLVADQAGEHLVKVYREEQASVPITAAAVDFTEDELLGAVYITQHDNHAYGLTGPVVVFDNALFSRNIYVTHTDNSQSGVGYGCNYYIELEEVKVGAAGMAQLAVAAARRT